MQLQTKAEQIVHDFIRDALDDVDKNDIIRHFEGQMSSETVVNTLSSLEHSDVILRHGDGVYTLNPKIIESGIELVLLD